MTKTMPAEPTWLRAEAQGRPIGVDREKNVLRGYVVAQQGPFKSKGRGEFDRKSLTMIRDMINAERLGLKSRFTHPDLSNDGLGKFLGRARNASIEANPSKGIDMVRADLHFDASAFDTPSGDLAGYVMRAADSDPEALSSSLVLSVDKKYRLNDDGTRQKDDQGEDLPPLWYPKALHASDIVDTGDAVDGILSAEIDIDRLPDAVVRRASEALDQLFSGQTREVVETRVGAYLERYLNRRFGEPAGPSTALLRRRLRLKEREFSTRM